MEPQGPIISLRNISRVFQMGDGTRVKILDNVSLDIERGSFNVIRGESGSGKTTILRILGLLDTGFEGDFLFENVSIRDKPDWYLDELRANNIGFIFQEGRLFRHMTLRRNIEIPMVLHGVRDQGELHRRISEIEPTFYSAGEREKDTLSRKPGSVSGGQAQRGSIMRAIIDRPSIILADEPTASLHGDLKSEVVEHLRSLCDAGHTVIVVSHDHVFYDFGRQLELVAGVLHEIDAGGAAAAPPLPSVLPNPKDRIWAGWWPRAPFSILARQALRETVLRPLFLSLILVALIVGIVQVSVFTSVILGAQAFVNEKITQGSRLNRIQIKPKNKDRSNDDRFPDRAAVAALPDVMAVVARRTTTTRVVVREGEPKTYSASGLHPGDPENKLLTFVAGGPFSDPPDRPEIILSAALLNDVFDLSEIENGSGNYDALIGRDVTILVNRYNRKKDLVREDPVKLKLTGIILNGEAGRQLYLPNTTLLLVDALIRDRDVGLELPADYHLGGWPEPAKIAEMANFPWEDSLHVYSKEIAAVLPLYTALSRLGFRPESDIWDFKWALDIQDTAWRVFVPMLVLIVLGVGITVAANIFTGAKLRETELALWRVLGMRRGDLVLTQVMSTVLSVAAGALSGIVLGASMVGYIRHMLEQRSAETAAATGEEAQQFDAIFAPVSSFFWPLFVGAILIGVLAALYPSVRAAKTDPAKVLQS